MLGKQMEATLIPHHRVKVVFNWEECKEDIDSYCDMNCNIPILMDTTFCENCREKIIEPLHLHIYGKPGTNIYPVCSEGCGINTVRRRFSR